MSNVRPYFTLTVPAGSYSANSLLGLLIAVIGHRLWHWCRGEGLID